MSSSKDFKLKISGNESVEAVGTFNGEGVYKVRKGGGGGGKAQPTYKYITIDNKPVDGRKVKRFSNKGSKKDVKYSGNPATPPPVGNKNDKIGKLVKKNTPKPVIKKNVIIKETPKPSVKQAVIEIADKEKARLKKLEPKKQTTDQLEKRRIKYQENREKELARKRAYREANKQEINAKQDAYRKTGESKEYQKAYREKNAKIFEPRRTATEVKMGVKAYGLGKGMLRYKKDIDDLMKKHTDTPRKVRNDAGKSRGEYKKKEKVKLVRLNIPEPKQKSGESSEVFATRLGLWDMVRQGKLSPANLTMRKAVLLTYESINYDGESITTAEWIRRLEKNGRDIEKDGLGVGNLKMAEIDPDAVY